MIIFIFNFAHSLHLVLGLIIGWVKSVFKPTWPHPNQTEGEFFPTESDRFIISNRTKPIKSVAVGFVWASSGENLLLFLNWNIESLEHQKAKPKIPPVKSWKQKTSKCNQAKLHQKYEAEPKKKDEVDQESELVFPDKQSS